MEHDGILNAWTIKLRMKSAKSSAKTIDSAYSRKVDLLFLPVPATATESSFTLLDDIPETFLHSLNFKPSTRPGRPPEGSRPAPPASSASCPLSAFPKACAFG